jgi:hypothetical protein
MAREVYTDSEFIEFSHDLVMVRIFADTSTDGKKIADMLHVDGYPTLVLFAPNGKIAGQLEGARSAEQLMDELESMMDDDEPDEDSGREPSNPITVENNDSRTAVGPTDIFFLPRQERRRGA